MPRGGLRTTIDGKTNHLFTPKWNNKKTVAVRVPEVFKSTLLKIARYLDKTTVINLNDQEIIDDVANCFRYKDLWSKYKKRLLELRQEKKSLLQEIDKLSNQNKQENNQDKYKNAVECFDEFLKFQKLNINDLSKSRKGTKKRQLIDIRDWLIEQAETTK